MSYDELKRVLPQVGEVTWIGLRPEREAPMRVVEEAMVRVGTGLDGDRYKGSNHGKRQVTLIQAEHLEAIGSYLGGDSVDPSITRRNVVVRGINLLALKGRRFRLGDALLEHTDACAPCAKMEAALGPGGFNAMRGHGGLCARVLEEGRVKVGDAVRIED